MNALAVSLAWVWLLGATPECEGFLITDTLVVGAGPGRLSSDGLRFVCGLVEPDGRQRLYVWSRRSLRARWKGPVPLGVSVDSASSIQPTLSDDGLRLVFVRNQEGRWEDNDLWMAERCSTRLPFGAPRPLDELNTDDVEAYPLLSGDGRRLYYTCKDGIMVSVFDEKRGRFGEPEPVAITGIREGVSMSSCWLSPDELTLVGMVFSGALLYARRPSLDAGFTVVDCCVSFDMQGVFLSCPSFSPKGELYLYASAGPTDEPGAAEPHASEMILVLKCKGEQ